MFSLVVFLAAEITCVLGSYQLTKGRDVPESIVPLHRWGDRGTEALQAPRTPSSERACRQHTPIGGGETCRGSGPRASEAPWQVGWETRSPSSVTPSVWGRLGLLVDLAQWPWSRTFSVLHGVFPRPRRGNGVSGTVPGRVKRERNTPTSFCPREVSNTITDKSEQHSQYEFN